ncbi:MAG: dihydroneopterin aldolase [Pseudomonadota bacterium]
MWPAGTNYQKLSLSGVRVAIRVGAFAHEKTAPQTIEVDVELCRRHDGYRGEGLDGCLNYDPLYLYLTEDWPARDHLDLLEAWAEDLVGFCLEDHKVDACRIRIRKTEVYPGGAVPEIEVCRHRHTEG